MGITKKPLVLDQAGDWQQMQAGDSVGVEQGGTGAVDAAGARTNLGVPAATDVNQQFSVVTAEIAAVRNVALAAAPASALAQEVVDRAAADQMLVPKTTTVNGYPLTGNISLSFADVQAIAMAMLGVANGVATLGADGRLPLSQMNETLLGAMVYQGVWDAATNTPDLTAVAAKGHYYKVNVAGSTLIDGHSVWQVGDLIVSNGVTWDQIDGATSEVRSVFGRVGDVVLTSDDVTTALQPRAIGNDKLANPAVADLSGVNTGDQTIVLGGDVTGSGTGNIDVALAPTGIAAGTYNEVVVDAKGRAIAGHHVDYNGTAFINGDAGVLLAGAPVYASNPDTIKGAIATAKNTATVVGLVAADIQPTAEGIVKNANELVLTAAQWDAITGGVGGLVFGSTYFVSDVAPGMLSNTPPNTGFYAPVGEAVSATRMSIKIGTRIQL